MDFNLVIHQSFVTTPPPPAYLRGRMGDSRAKVRGNYIFNVPAVHVKWQGFDIKIFTRERFSIAKGREKRSKRSIVLTLRVGSIAGH